MGYWPSVRSRWLDIGQVLFCVFMDRDEVEVHKVAKKERGQYPAILTEQTWSIKDLLYCFWWNFACGIQRVVPSGQDGSMHLARSGSQSQRVIWFILPARGANHIINCDKALHTLENSWEMFSTFSLCSQMPVVFYQCNCTGLGFSIC